MAVTNAELIASMGLTQETIDDLQSNMQSTWEPAANLFIDTLYNLIGMQLFEGINFTDPFTKYFKEPLEVGDTIQHIRVLPTKGFEYDAEDETSPFKTNKPTVKTLYSRINYRYYYETTINVKTLKEAMRTPTGLSEMIKTIIEQLDVTKLMNRYFAEIAVFATASNYVGGRCEEIDYDSSVDGDYGKKLVKTLMLQLRKFKTISQNNNKQGVIERSEKSDLVMIATPELLTEIDTALLGVYNLKLVDIVDDIITIESFNVNYTDLTTPSAPVEKSTESDVEFVIIDKRAIDFHNTMLTTGDIINPRTLDKNMYTHDWNVLAINNFYNAKAFKMHDTKSAG